MEEKTTVTTPTQNVSAVFAINPRLKDSRTGKVQGKYHRGYAEPGNEEQILQMLARPDMPQMLNAIRQEGHDEVKDELPTLCPHYAAFRNNHRAQADIIPEAFTYKTCIDSDDQEFTEKAISRALEVNADEYSDFCGMVEYIDRSPRMKCHIWLRMPVGMTIEETQKAFCEEMEVPYDSSCTTPERYINMTGDEVYRSPQWLKPLTADEVEQRREAFLARGLDVDGRPLSKPSTTQPTPLTTPSTPHTTPRTHYIFEACLKEAGLQHSDLTEEGGRHNAWLSVLSVGGAKLLTREELLALAQELAPDYSQEKEFGRLVDDFYQKYSDPSQKMTQFQRRVFAQSRRLDQQPAASTSTATSATEPTTALYGDTASLNDIYASPQPPKLSEKARPAFVKAATQPVPKDAKETAAQAMFPPLGMYCDASFVYDDGTPREPRLNCLIIAGTGSGKDSSTKFMLQHLMAPRQKEDTPNRIKLEEWKAECKRKESKNEDKPQRPNVDVRSVAANITPARLSELMADSQGRIIHTYMIEFDQWFGIEGWKPGTNCPFTNLKLTDDEDNPFGQERVGRDSITYRGPLSINWNASTTTSKAQHYFRNVMTDGPISRLGLATTIDRGLGAPMPKHGKYDQKYDDTLMPYINNLRKAHGVVTCQPALRMVKRLKKELDGFVVQTSDAVLDNLGHRALVQVFRKACLLYVANGMKWERSIEAFCRWSLHYDLWLKLHFFGDIIRSAEVDVKTSRKGPRNLLQQLPDNFTKQEACNVRQLAGKSEEGTNNMLYQWVHRGYILQLTADSYKKVKSEEPC